MSILKKITTIILTIAMLTCSLSIIVYADAGNNKSVDAVSGKKYSFSETKAGSLDNLYKINVSNKGNVKININLTSGSAYLIFINSNDTYLEPSNISMTSGSCNRIKEGKNVTLSLNSGTQWKSTRQPKGTIEYNNLEQGIYYIEIKSYTYTDTKLSGNIIFTYPSATNELGRYDAPKNIDYSTTNTSATLTWDTVAGADSYRVYILKYNSSKYEKYKNVSSTKCVVKGLDDGKTYKFKIAALVKVGEKLYEQKKSKAISVKTNSSSLLPSPSNIKYSTSKSSIILSWDKVSKASAYRVYMYDKTSQKYNTVKNVSATKCEITGLTEEIAYKFKVAALAKNGNSYIVQNISNAVSALIKHEPTLGEKNALKKAHDYLAYSSFSYSGLIKQLEFEGFTNAEAKYAADNCGADWNEQAAKKAKSYMDYSSFSRKGLIEQLLYEGFTQSQAEYGAKSVGY